MKKRACLTLIIMVLAGVRSAQATSGGLAIPDRQAVLTTITSNEALFGLLTLNEGEVVSVDGDRLQLVTGSGLSETYTIPSSCPVYINGRQGSLSALRPVAPGSFFATRLYVDHDQIPRLIDGWYVGGLVVIIAADSQHHTLCVQAVESNKVYHLAVSPALRGEVSRLAPGKTCFLLLGWEAQVRKIYVDQ